MSLLKQALAKSRLRKIPSDITDEEIELALAWANGKVNYIQVQKLLVELDRTTKGSGTYSFLARALRAHIIRTHSPSTDTPPDGSVTVEADKPLYFTNATS